MCVYNDKEEMFQAEKSSRFRANREYGMIGKGWRVPLKIKKLKAALLKAGCYSRTAKGSHTKWRHPDLPGITVMLSGKDGDDAKPYQVDDVQDLLRKLGKEL